MKASAAGDRSKRAFEELYDRVAERLLVHLVRRMQDVEAATELWSECWAVAFEGWSRCSAGSPGEAEAWVFGIARRQLASYYRSGAIRRRALQRLRWTAPSVGGAEHDELERIAALDAITTELADALARLPTRRRRALQLRVVAGLPYSEVAARMACSEQAARAHVSRGLRGLAQVLDHDRLVELEGDLR